MTTPKKHKTVGISFHPDLKESATHRAKSLGFTLSRYVTLCVEAELQGRVQRLVNDEASPASPAATQGPRSPSDHGNPECVPGQYPALDASDQGVSESGNSDALAAAIHLMDPESNVDLDDAIERGSQYIERKAQSIEFEDDIEDIIASEEYCFSRNEKVAHTRVDFFIQHVSPDNGKTCRIALECSHNIRHRYTVTLGQTIILKSLPTIDAVILVVPYLKNFDQQIRQTFQQQGIPVATPDNLIEEIQQAIETFENGSKP